MQDLTKKELQHLTMKQLREYAVMKGAKKVPKKWTDKPTALKWLEKNLSIKPAKAASIKPTTKPKKKKTGGKDDRQAIARRHGMVIELRKNPCTTLELKDMFGNEYKSVLDDLHAIRHNRNEEDYLDKGELLVGVYIGRSKVFQIIKTNNEEKAMENLKQSIEVV